jgi:hypothetical protein
MDTEKIIKVSITRIRDDDVVIKIYYDGSSSDLGYGLHDDISISLDDYGNDVRLKLVADSSLEESGWWYGRINLDLPVHSGLRLYTIMFQNNVYGFETVGIPISFERYGTSLALRDNGYIQVMCNFDKGVMRYMSGYDYIYYYDINLP